MEMQGNGGMCKCPHHKVTSGLVVLFGLAFLLQALNVLDAGTVAVVWPIIVIVLGLSKMCKCCSHPKM